MFSHACEIDDPALKSIAPDDLKVENFTSRMQWIGKAAEKFHQLMDKKSAYMAAEIRTMAGWKNSADALLVY